MSLGKKLFGIFVDTNDDEKLDQLAKPDPSKPLKTQMSSGSTMGQSISTAPVMSTNYQDAVVVGGSMEDLTNFRKHFKELLEQNNLPGLDYLEFIQAKNAMPLPVEAQKYTVAFAAQQAAGLTKETLLTTADKYLGMIENEVNEFNAAFKDKYSSDVENKNAIIEQKNQQMIELSQQISALDKEIRDLKDQTLQNDSGLKSKQAAFMQAATEAKQAIDGEKMKINQFIS